MRVTLFGRVNTDSNPYILLYKKALERQGLVVDLERDFNLKWLVTRGSSCDAVHLHWIEGAYRPVRLHIRSTLLNRLVNNRLVTPLRGALQLVGFSAALLLAKLQGKAIVYTVHDLTSHFRESRSFIALGRTAHRVVFSLAHRVHVHNQYTRRILEGEYGRKEDVIVVPHGNYVGCYPNQVSQSEARRQLGLPEDAFVYLFLGMVRPYKGIEELIDAFEGLEFSLARLLIVGRALNDSYGAEIRSLCQGKSAIKHVLEFVPGEAIQFYMNACDIFVLPYRKITTSGSAALAMSFGRPVIAPSIASLPEVVTPETGILYDPSQPGDLASALQQSRQRAWSESEILDYVHQIDWDRLGPQLAGLYRI